MENINRDLIKNLLDNTLRGKSIAAQEAFSKITSQIALQKINELKKEIGGQMTSGAGSA